MPFRTLLAAIMMVIAAAPAHSQDVGSTTYLLLHGADTVAVETITRSATGYRGRRLMNRVAMTDYRIDIGSDERVRGFVRESDRLGRIDSIEFSTPEGTGAVMLSGQSIGALELIARRGQTSGSTGGHRQVPVWRVNRGAADTAYLQVVPSEAGGVEVSLRLGSVRVVLLLDEAGHITAGSFPDHGIDIVVAAPVGGVPEPEHPYGAPAGAGYAVEQVTVTGAAGYRLAGTLTLPRRGAAPPPAVVLVTGLRPNDRNNAGPPAYVPFRELADVLTRRGIAVLRLDDRGVGGSEGDHGSATSYDEAADIGAAVAYLRSRRDLSGTVGLLGLSEGAVVAPLTAAEDSTLAAVALLGAPGGPMAEVLDYQIRGSIEANAGIAPAARDSVVAERYASAMRATPRIRSFFSMPDVRPTATRIATPILIVNGLNDRQIPPRHPRRLADAIVAAGNHDVTLHTLPGLSHLLVPDPDGRAAEWSALPSLALAPEVLTIVADWFAVRLSRPD